MKTSYEIKDNTATIKINKNIYTKEVLMQTTYVKLEEFYFLIDEKDNYYIISMKYKEESEQNNLEKAVYKFFDELIESQAYIDQLRRTSKTREIILERALIGQTIDDETLESLKEIQEEEKTEQ